jgi:hypothetical protein
MWYCLQPHKGVKSGSGEFLERIALQPQPRSTSPMNKKSAPPKPLDRNKFSAFVHKYVAAYTGKVNGEVSCNPNWPKFFTRATQNHEAFLTIQGEKKERRFRFDWNPSKKTLSVQRLNSGNFEMKELDMTDVHNHQVVATGAQFDGQTAVYEFAA